MIITGVRRGPSRQNLGRAQPLSGMASQSSTAFLRRKYPHAPVQAIQLALEAGYTPERIDSFFNDFSEKTRGNSVAFEAIPAQLEAGLSLNQTLLLSRNIVVMTRNVGFKSLPAALEALQKVEQTSEQILRHLLLVIDMFGTKGGGSAINAIPALLEAGLSPDQSIKILADIKLKAGRRVQRALNALPAELKAKKRPFVDADMTPLERFRNLELRRALPYLHSYERGWIDYRCRGFDRDKITCNVQLPYLLHSLGLTLREFLAAVNDLIINSACEKIDAIEISDSATKIKVQEKMIPYGGKKGICLVIPERILTTDPALLEPKPRFSPKNISASLGYIDPLRTCMDRGLLTVAPREEVVLKMRLGCNPERKMYTLPEVSDELEVTSERARQIEAKALRKLRHPSRFASLQALQEIYSRKLAGWFKYRFIVTVEELEQALISENHLDEREKGTLLAAMLLYRMITGHFLTEDVLPEIQGNLEILDLVEGNRVVSAREGRDVFICRDFDAYSRIVSYWTNKCSQRVMGIEEYRAFLRDEMGIYISNKDLKLILYAHEKINIEDDVIFPSKIQRTIYYIQKILKEKGPLHYTQIGAQIASHTGLNEKTVLNILRQDESFVLIGNGIYDLMDNHPELKDVLYPRRIRRKSVVFAAIYSILKDGRFLTVTEIQNEMQSRGYRWGGNAISMVLSHKKYKPYFLMSRVGRAIIVGLRKLEA